MALTKITSDGITDGTITGTDLATNVDLVDNQKLRLGTGNDLEIFHDSSHSIINDSVGSLLVRSNIVQISTPAGSKYFKGQSGVAELYHSDSKKFETTSAGATVTGSLTLTDDLFLSDANVAYFGTNNDLRIYHSGTHGYIKNTTNNLYIMTTNSEYGALLYANGGVELRYDNVKKFETVSNGARVIGSLGVDELYMGDNEQIKIGAEDDFLIYHGGSENVLDGVLHKIELRHGSEKHLVAHPDAAVELYYDNSKKFETTSNGATVTGNLFATNKFRGNDNVKLELGTGNDLQIYHDGTNSFIVNNDGDLLIRNTTGNEIKLQAVSGEQSIQCIGDGAVELYHDGSKKFETFANGITVSSDNAQLEIESSSSGTSTAFGVFKGYRIVADVGRLAELQFINQRDNDVQAEIEVIANGDTNSYFDFKTSNAGLRSLRIHNTGTHLPDNFTANYGNSNDLQIYHDGSNSHIAETGTGVLKISGSAGVYINKHDNSETMAAFLHDAGVELYFNNSKKFETTSAGATVTGTLTATSFSGDGSNLTGVSSVGGNTGVKFNDDVNITLGTGNDTLIRHVAGSHTEINHVGTGDLILETVNGGDDIMLDSNDDIFLNHAGESMIVCRSDAQVELYYDNSKKFFTSSSGAQVTGSLQLTEHLNLNNGKELKLGDSSQMTIWHSGSDFNMYNNSGQLIISNASGTGVGEGAIVFKSGSNSTRWYISSGGHFYPAANNSFDIGTTSNRVRNIYTNDLNLSNEGGANDVDGTWGSYTIQEGAESLFLINKRNGKKYKFNLTEVQ